MSHYARAVIPSRTYPTACFAAKDNEENFSLTCQSIEHASLIATVLNFGSELGETAKRAIATGSCSSAGITARPYDLARQGAGVRAAAFGGFNMHRDSLKLIPLALIAAIGLGMPALAKTMQSGKAKRVTSPSTQDINTQRARALNASRSPGRTFRAPIGGSYSANLYVY